jgi:hypothetical protein
MTLSPGANAGCLYGLNTQHDPWRPSNLAWRTGGDDDEEVYGRVGVPFVFRNTGMQMLHQPHQITFLYDEDNIVRRVRMNQPHRLPVTPSWYGDSVGHYEGDTLVVDTIGIKIGPFAVIDVFGTPRTRALHVIERYRLIDYEAAIEAEERTLPADRGRSDAILPVDPDYKGTRGSNFNSRSRMKVSSRCPGRRP